LENVRQVVNGIEQRFNFVYDNGGRRERLKYFKGGAPTPVTETKYQFNTANMLENIQHLQGANILENLIYGYDANGNRTSMNRPSVTLPLPNPASNTSYNEANQMLTFNDKNIVYDNNGNMTSVTNACGTTTYTWNARNQLAGINGFKPDCSSLTASFNYDSLNRRIEKTINGLTTKYRYDGADIIQELNQDGSVKANYIRGLNIDEPLLRSMQNAVRFYLTDALGSVIALTDENGIVKTTYSYDPFGNTTISGEASDNPFQYTGRENDGTGLYYYRARYYSPELQRFISEDPIGFDGGDVNLMAYVGNNPVNFVDPLGLWRWPGSIYDEAMKDAATKFPNSQHNGLGDAYRHCLASCMMTKENGVVSADVSGWANEKRGDWTHNQECGERAMV
jgi:RHS repeat-associated protein